MRDSQNPILNYPHTPEVAAEDDWDLPKISEVSAQIFQALKIDWLVSRRIGIFFMDSIYIYEDTCLYHVPCCFP